MFGFHNFIKKTVLYFNELVSFVAFEMKFLNFNYTDMEADGGISLELPFSFLVIFYSYT